MGKPRLIILIRHAQSEGNKNREIHQVVPDHRVKLTEDGRRQAEEAGRRLRHLLRPDDSLQIFTSPYRRTRETTEGILRTLTSHNDADDPEAGPSPFSRSKITVYEEPRLREQDFGNFQPSSTEMERMWQERADYGHFFYRIPNGESAADAYDRISGFNESLWRQFGDEDFPSVLVLVTHGLMTRVFLMKWYHWSVEYFEDLRNINHCEFILMSRSPSTGKYLLENKLRTWSELRRQKAEEAMQDPIRRNTLSAFLDTSQKSPSIQGKKWSGDSHAHVGIQLPRQQKQQGHESTYAEPTPTLPAPAQDPESKKNEGDDHPLAPHEKPSPPLASTDGVSESSTAATKEPTTTVSLPRSAALPDHLLSEQGGGGVESSGITTPHEMSEDEAEYFHSRRQPRSMARAMQRAPQRRLTPEDVARWANESGMGKGKQADALGDEPETVSPSASGDDGGGEGRKLHQDDDADVLEDLHRAEDEDRSLRGSVY